MHATAIPAALRPIGLGEEDDGDHLPAFVPPRHFGQGQDPIVSMPAAAHESAVPAHVEPEAPQAADPVDPNESSDLDEGYSSLLSLSRPGAGQQRFVRIEEPENPSAEIEPVVIFPGKEPHSGEGPFARPFAAPGVQAAEPAGERGARDPQETDRALRTALANIQRMSGAA